MRSYIDSSKNSRRDSLASKISSSHLPIAVTSNFIKGGKEDKSETPKNSLSRIGLNSKLKQNNSETNKKKPEKAVNKKREVSKAEPCISGTMIPDVSIEEANTKIAELIEETEPPSKKFTKPFAQKHRLAMFKNANSKLLINNN